MSVYILMITFVRSYNYIFSVCSDAVQTAELLNSSSHSLHTVQHTSYGTSCLQRPGSEIAVYGTVTCESDIPKKCFSTTFCADDRKAMDYFNCKSCKINCEIVSHVCK